MWKPVSKDVSAIPKAANKEKMALGIALPAKRFARKSAAFVDIAQAATEPPAPDFLLTGPGENIITAFDRGHGWSSEKASTCPARQHAHNHSRKLGNESCQRVE